MANTEVDDQISAIEMAMKARCAIDQPRDRRRCVMPSDCSALFTRPILSLNMNLNWKPTRIGENIIGNIMMRAQDALAARRLLDQQREAEAKQHFEIERDGEQQHRAAERPPEIGVGQDRQIIPEADEDIECLGLGQAEAA